RPSRRAARRSSRWTCVISPRQPPISLAARLRWRGCRVRSSVPRRQAAARAAARYSVVVGRFGGFLELAVRLVEQFLGLLRVPTHVPLVRGLCGADLFPRLSGEPLRGGR